MCKRVLFQLGIKKGKLCLDKMYIMIYICIYQSGGNVPAQKRTVEMKTYTIEQQNYDAYRAAANMAEYSEKLEEIMKDVDETDDCLWSAGNGKLWVNEYHFGKKLAEAAKKWKQAYGEHIKDFHYRILDWLFINNEED